MDDPNYASASEGEIIETREKQLPRQNSTRESTVDPPIRPSSLRNVSRSPSPYRNRRDRACSPYRHRRISPRGKKRNQGYDDTHYRRDGRPHQRRRHDDEDRNRNKPSLVSYADLDEERNHDDRYEDRGRHHNKYSNHSGPYSHNQRAGIGYSSAAQDPPRTFNLPRRPSVGSRGFDSVTRPAPKEESKKPATKTATALPDSAVKIPIVEVPDIDPEPVMDDAQLEAMREAKRKRREATRKKYQQQEPLLQQALSNDMSMQTTPSTAMTTEASTPNVPSDNAALTPGESNTRSVSPQTDGHEPVRDNSAPISAHGSPSVDAAEYDPTADMEDDRRREMKKHQQLPEDAKPDGPPAALPATKETAKPKKEFDMFDMDAEDDEIFASTHEEESDAGRVLDRNMLDNWDDANQYLRIIPGERLDDRYKILEVLGKGMFAVVVRAEDSKAKQMVAIKIVRNNNAMKISTEKEMRFLQKLNEADPDDKKHIVRMMRSFFHKGHLCVVFEELHQNLRDLGKSQGSKGIHISAVKHYAKQMFTALGHMKKLNIVHADLKPDNILVTKDHRTVKICDLGSGFSINKPDDATTYLVSRFYRAPEIILGMKIDFAIDMWAIGCTLFELWTGKILFPGANNNHMLKVIMECRGGFSPKFLKKGMESEKHFTNNLEQFVSVELDTLGKPIVRMETFKKPKKDLKTRVLEAAPKDADPRDRDELLLFVDLLDKCLNINPEKRILPHDALLHSFLRMGTSAPKFTSRTGRAK